MQVNLLDKKSFFDNRVYFGFTFGLTAVSVITKIFSFFAPHFENGCKNHSMSRVVLLFSFQTSCASNSKALIAKNTLNFDTFKFQISKKKTSMFADQTLNLLSFSTTIIGKLY